MSACAAQFLKTVLILPVLVAFNACSSDLESRSDGSVVRLVNVPTVTSPVELVQSKLEVTLNRHGFEGGVQVDFQNLPAGVKANTVTLEPNQDVASFVLTGLPKSMTKTTVRLRFAGLKVSRLVSLTESKLSVDLPGGTFSQTLRNINSNVDSSVFVTHQVYANFKGSSCQVMVRALNAGLYVCFNDAIQAGQTYNLITSRDAIPGTVSITYFQGPAASSSRQALWDSISGRIEVLSVSRTKIEFSISAATFAPAKGFGKNLAIGEFMLEASTTVTDISNLP
jgi:hypothetical protein